MGEERRWKMRITPLDIRQKEFKNSFKGYNVKEVQDFLLELASEYESSIDELNKLKKEKEQLLEELESYHSYDHKLKDTLLAAQEMSGELKANAEKEAQLIIKDAKLQAEEIHRQTRNTLEKLEKEIEDLRSQKKNFQAKLRSLIESHLKMMEEETQEKSGRGGRK
jgi:cell division initiation protein